MSDVNEIGQRKPVDMMARLALIGVGGAMTILALLAIFAGSGIFDWRDKGICDDAIKATLRAPATYRRVEFSGSDGLYLMSYDAENGFGVPLRSNGVCNVDRNTSTASWRRTGPAE